MNIIHNLGSFKRALSVYDDKLKLRVTVDGVQVALNNDNQLGRLIGGTDEVFALYLSLGGKQRLADVLALAQTAIIHSKPNQGTPEAIKRHNDAFLALDAMLKGNS